MVYLTKVACLTEMASQFQRLECLALNAAHGADNAFEDRRALRITPAVMSRMKPSRMR